MALEHPNIERYLYGFRQGDRDEVRTIDNSLLELASQLSVSSTSEYSSYTLKESCCDVRLLRFSAQHLPLRLVQNLHLVEFLLSYDHDRVGPDRVGPCAW